TIHCGDLILSINGMSLAGSVHGDVLNALDVISVELWKTSAGLGFSLDGGKASITGDRPLLVKRIFKGGAAEQAGKIEAGDEIVAISGKSLIGLMHYDAWNIIKSVPEGPVQLLIRKISNEASGSSAYGVTAELDSLCH
uniref:PDZ domain-containing protein n=1 Tax=Chelonoidis abingdonii TaxID=106734 RepID=A0A8C0GJD0_CHEAB